MSRRAHHPARRHPKVRHPEARRPSTPARPTPSEVVEAEADSVEIAEAVVVDGAVVEEPQVAEPAMAGAEPEPIETVPPPAPEPAGVEAVPSAMPPAAGPPGAATAPQLRRFIKSRPYIPMHELRRRFGINVEDDDVSVIDLDGHRLWVGLPAREGSLLGELLRSGDIGYEASVDPIAPVIVGVFPIRPVARS